MTTCSRKPRFLLLAGAALCGLASPVSAFGQTAARVHYDLPRQDLGDALRRVASLSGWEIMFTPQEVAQHQAPALSGDLTVQQAVARLLAGTSLTADYKDRVVIIRGRAAAPESIAQAPAEPDNSIVVTGTRIRGAASPSPTTVIRQEDMRNAGQSNLSEVVRTVSQNFSGGQNPNVGAGVPTASGINVGSGSTINLRGLGSDATLTLLNGHRLAYNVSRQSVDISAIPLAAVDRLEIVADGASAIYGSDAVGGVANIILKRDFDGLSTTARLGGSTDGGDFQQQYGVVGGRTWHGGGVLLAYDFERDTAISARQRDYTTSNEGGQTLLPAIKRHNLLLNGHQELLPGVTFSVDALYNHRDSLFNAPFLNTGDYKSFGALYFPRNTSFAIAPSIDWSIGNGWNATVAGMVGKDLTHYDSDNYLNGAITSSIRGCYCNDAQSVEVNAGGPLFRLPGGDAKVALGGGYRNNGFNAYRTVGAAQNIHVSQSSYFAFGELSLPLVSSPLGIPLVDQFIVSAALRYEDYPGIDKLATPKLGLIYAPTPDFSLKGSWGKSFKAPTLYLQYAGKNPTVIAASALGGTGYPANATAILVVGGNPQVKPERATSWTTTLDVHPRGLAGLQVELSYFQIAYKDRIVAPITFFTQSLSSPNYRDLVTLSPTDQQKADALAGADSITYAAGVYDPARVVAIVDDRNRNAAEQAIRGIDLAVRYAIDLDGAQKLSLNASGTYLHSKQRLSASQPEQLLAGTVFNPPHYKGRASATWSDGATTLTGAVNYVGGNDDVRFVPAVRVGAMTSFDLTARHRTRPGGLFGHMELALSLQNLFNAEPDRIRQVSSNDLTYDSANYSAIGRFISLSITKAW